MRSAPAFAAILLAALAPLAARPAAAGPRACAELKPAQSLPVERQQAVDTVVQARVAGAGGGSVAVATTTAEQNAVTLLGADDLARAWYVYQLCILRASDTIDARTHDALLRATFGLPPTALAPAPALPGAPALPTGAPVAVPVAVGSAGTSALRFQPTPTAATLVVAQCPERVFGGSTPAVRLPAHWTINGERLLASTKDGFAVDLPPGRASLALRVTTLTDQTEFQVEAGAVYYLAVDYTFGALRSLLGVRLRPTDAAEGEAILDRCFTLRRRSL